MKNNINGMFDIWRRHFSWLFADSLSFFVIEVLCLHISEQGLSRKPLGILKMQFQYECVTFKSPVHMRTTKTYLAKKKKKTKKKKKKN